VQRLERRHKVVRRLPVLEQLGLDLGKGGGGAAQHANGHTRYQLASDEAKRDLK
jgi:hypothetical protein